MLKRTKFPPEMIRTKFPNIPIEKHFNLIKKIALSFHYSSGVNFQDLFQEGCIAYLKGIDFFNPNKAKISTFVWRCVNAHLINYLHKYEPNCFNDVEIEEKATEGSYLIDNLNEEAQEMVEVILQCRKKYVHLSSKETITRLTYIFKAQGWSKEKIDSGINCLKNAF